MGFERLNVDQDFGDARVRGEDGVLHFVADAVSFTDGEIGVDQDVEVDEVLEAHFADETFFRVAHAGDGAGEDQVWGFNALRTNRWKNELSFLSPTQPARGQAGIQQTSLAATVTGIRASAKAPCVTTTR